MSYTPRPIPQEGYSIDKYEMRFYVTETQYRVAEQVVKNYTSNRVDNFTGKYGFMQGVWFQSNNSRVKAGYMYQSVTIYHNAIDKRAYAVDCLTGEESQLRECIVTFNPNHSPYFINNGNNQNTATLLAVALITLFYMHNSNIQHLVHKKTSKNFNTNIMVDRYHVAHDLYIPMQQIMIDKGRKQTLGENFSHRNIKPVAIEAKAIDDEDSYYDADYYVESQYVGTPKKPGTTLIYDKTLQLTEQAIYYMSRNVEIVEGDSIGELNPSFPTPTRQELNDWELLKQKMQTYIDDIKRYYESQPVTRIEYDFGKERREKDRQRDNSFVFTMNPDLSCLKYTFPNIFTAVPKPDFSKLIFEDGSAVDYRTECTVENIFEGLRTLEESRTRLSPHLFGRLKYLVESLPALTPALSKSFTMNGKEDHAKELECCKYTIIDYTNGLYQYIYGLSQSGELQNMIGKAYTEYAIMSAD